MSTVARRHLLVVLSVSNFLQSKATFTNALQDPELSEFTGAIWYRKDKNSFEELMIKWLDDPKLQQYALQNSSMLSGNPKYVTVAMNLYSAVEQYISLLLLNRQNFAQSNTFTHWMKTV